MAFYLVALLSIVAATAGRRASGTVSVTPHDSYSSSVGVLGCKINTDRVAYWPYPVDCTNICVSLSYESRSVYLLRVDQSGGAHDVSYDAWNYLYTGSSAVDRPAAGGALNMQFKEVDASKCTGLIYTEGNKLPLSASNSMNFLSSCLNCTECWVAKHFALYNVVDAVCSLGYDEQCKLDPPTANQATCPHMLGSNVNLKGSPVYNIRYPTGEKIVASSIQPVVGDVDRGASPGQENAARSKGSQRLLERAYCLATVLYLIRLW